jgi:hypothetical protein
MLIGFWSRKVYKESFMVKLNKLIFVPWSVTENPERSPKSRKAPTRTTIKRRRDLDLKFSHAKATHRKSLGVNTTCLGTCSTQAQPEKIKKTFLLFLDGDTSDRGDKVQMKWHSCGLRRCKRRSEKPIREPTATYQDRRQLCREGS